MTTINDTYRLEPVDTSGGMMITAVTADADVGDLYRAGLDGLLARAGYLIIRGFNPTAGDFNSLVRHYSSRTTLDPARAFHGDTAQKVDSGYGPIGLHVENGGTPYAPDLLWFCCVKAASSGSQTTVCDGFRVWDALREQTRQLFATRPIRYTRGNIPAALWRRLAAFLAGDGARADEMTVADLYRLANDGAQVTITRAPDESISYEYTVHAAHPTQWSDRMAWANSILGPSHNYEAPDIRFADGSPIPGDVVAEYTEVTEAVTEEVQWRDGDIVLIDNTRVMHGRRAITDPDRTILNAQSYPRGGV
jgi:alpha-ketoglutarate-dependent taurine dioxygenase